MYRFLFILLLTPFALFAQSGVYKVDTNVVIHTDTSRLIVVASIQLEGNKITKPQIITRELSFRVGDTLSTLNFDAFLHTERNRIFNTGLFISVRLLFDIDSLGQGHLKILMKERWFWFPIPILELADRSFNEWWYNQNHDLRRINYGVRFRHANMRGRNEELKVIVQGGFTQKYEILYSIPYLTKSQKLGLTIGANFLENKQIAYRSLNNKQDFLKIEDPLLKRYSVVAGLSYRKSYYSFHNFDARYTVQQVNDTIQKLNPQYLNTGNNFQQYTTLRYTFSRDRRDIQAYALHGYLFNFETQKVGVLPSDNVNLWVSYAGLSKYFDLGRKFYLAAKVKGKFSIQEQQPYNMARAFGFGNDFVRGYDLNVVEGPTFGLFKSTLRRQLFQVKSRMNFIPIEQFREVPIAAYLNAYFDAGYVINDFPTLTNERLMNRWLPGGGIGLDVVTFYDLVIRMEYSYNIDGKANFFFYFTSDI